MRQVGVVISDIEAAVGWDGNDPIRRAWPTT
jgi:hypothetical protein